MPEKPRVAPPVKRQRLTARRSTGEEPVDKTVQKPKVKKQAPEKPTPEDAPGIAQPAFLWFGFLGGVAAWAVHLAVVYVLVEVGCNSNRLTFPILGIGAAEFLSLLVTVLAAFTALSAAFVAFWSQPNLETVEWTGAPEAQGRSRFMAYTGMIMSGLFFLAILAGGLPFFFLRSC